MSKRTKETRYENHRPAAELQDLPSHIHSSAAEQHGKQDHMTGAEQSRQSMEHARQTHASEQSSTHHSTDGAEPVRHEEIALLAHQMWHARGCPDGSPEIDWFRAEEQLRNKA